MRGQNVAGCILKDHAPRAVQHAGRATYLTATDAESLDAYMLLSKLEGILPAIESAHALARVGDIARDVGKDGVVVLNLSGRGDKDVGTVAAHLGMQI